MAGELLAIRGIGLSRRPPQGAKQSEPWDLALLRLPPSQIPAPCMQSKFLIKNTWLPFPRLLFSEGQVRPLCPALLTSTSLVLTAGLGGTHVTGGDTEAQRSPTAGKGRARLPAWAWPQDLCSPRVRLHAPGKGGAGSFSLKNHLVGGRETEAGEDKEADCTWPTA